MESALELRFPHIVSHLVEVWPREAEAARYLQDLLFVNRQRPGRHGFDEATWAELTFLNDLLQSRCPLTPSQQGTDIWAIAWDAQQSTPDTTS